MTSLVIDVRAPNGHVFELLVHFGETLTVAETAMEVHGETSEWRDTRSVLLLVGRKPRSAEGRS